MSVVVCWPDSVLSRYLRGRADLASGAVRRWQATEPRQVKEIAVADPGFDDQQLGTEGFRWAIAQLPAGKQDAATRIAD